MAKFCKFLLIFVCLLAITACWDRMEIEDRGFVIGIAVDLARNDEIRQEVKQEDPEHQMGDYRYVITLQFVSPSRSPNPQEGISGESTFNISAEGDTLFEADRGIALRSSRQPYYEHSKIAVLSEELAKEGQISNVLDIFLRSGEMKRAIKVMVSRTVDASEILDVKPDTGEMPILYIDSLTENNDFSTRMVPYVLLGDVHEYLLGEESFVLPGITSRSKNEVKISEAAIFRGDSKKLIGFLGEMETEGYNYLTDQIKAGVVETKIKDLLVAYEIIQSKTHIKADVTNKEKIRFQVDINTLGSISEKFADIDVMNAKTIAELEKRSAQEIERIIQLTIHKLRDVFKTDALQFGDYLRQNHYKFWKEIESDWDRGENYFSQCEIDVNVNTKVYSRGPIIKSHKGQKMR